MIAEYRGLDDFINKLPKEVIILDPSDYFCDLDCYVVLNGKALYFDQAHMSIYGSSIVADKIINKIMYP